MKEVYGGADFQWLVVYESWYEQIAPIIDRISKTDDYGTPAASFADYLQSYETLPPLLMAMKNAPKPKAKELRKSKKTYEDALHAWVKASECGMKLFREPSRARFAKLVYFSTIGAELTKEAAKMIVQFSGK